MAENKENIKRSLSALRCSFWIWLKRTEDIWTTGEKKNKQEKRVEEASFVEGRNVQTRRSVTAEETSQRVTEIRKEAEERGSREKKKTKDPRRRNVATRRSETAEYNNNCNNLWVSSVVTPVLGINSPNRRCRGLKNLGNTCFRNAVLQCLWLITQGHAQRKRKHSDELIKEFWCLMDEMSSDKRIGPISPTKVNDTLVKKFRQFGGSCQQDAHEFLMVMLEQLSEYGPDCFKVIVYDMQTRIRKERWFYLSKSIRIPSAAEKSSVTLSDCIEESFMEEIIADGWSCSHCGARNSGVKKEVCVGDLPRLLIVQLKRLKCTGRGYIKDRSAVKLQRGPFKINNTKYIMKGVVNHVGVCRTLYCQLKVE